MNKMKFLLMSVVFATFASCGTTSTVPLTGRKHRISMTDGELLTLSQTQYSKFMASVKKSSDVKNTQMVARVGRKLANAVENYLRNNGYANEIQNFQWEFNLVQDKQANAFCMPGGKIVVYEGLLPYTQNVSSLAIVLGHEIAHAVAKHSAEQITKQQNQGIGTAIIGTVLNTAVGSGTGDIFNSVASTGLSLLNLKYSRSNETEADYMGLMFAAMAGYDPQAAVPFWQRMAANSQSSTLPFMSSHPSDASRIQKIQEWMPEAMKVYQANKVATKPATTTKKKRKR